MAPSPQLAPPGSSTYSSNTMNVGDGTWDSSRNSFLLPNLVGFNFATMQYNGMGNRFAGMPEYHSVIRGHGIVAAITFLLIIPSAIFIARYYYARPRWALRAHIWLQILTLILSTVVFILGWFAVGPERSLTNPHHGIGLALYIFILTQGIWGWFMHKREKGKERTRPSIKLMIHQWYGRMIALLGMAQVGLGLTLYGSPKVLFILYALVLFAWLCIYFVLAYRDTARKMHHAHGSYTSGTEVLSEPPERRHSRLGRIAGLGAAGAALAALRNRSRNRSRSRDGRRHSRVDVVGSHANSESYIDSEKYDDRRPAGGGLRDRLLKIGAIAGAAGLAKKYLGDRRNERDHDTLRPPGPLGGPHSISQDSLSRIEEGRPPSRIPQQNVLHRRRSGSQGSFSSHSSYTVGGRRRHRGHKLRDGVATLGALGLFRAALKSRRERKEERRIDALRQREIEDERVARQNSNRYTGDGFPRRAPRRGSLTSTDATSTTDSEAHPQPRYNPNAPPPIPAGYAAGVGTGAALANPGAHAANAPLGNLPPPPPPSGPILPGPGQPLPPQSSGSDIYTTTSGRRHHRHHPARDAAAAGLAAGTAAEMATGGPSSGGGGVASPPRSVKVKVNMHNNGRNVTLRRLPEAEAAAEREAKRRDRANRHRRRGSASSLSGTDTGLGAPGTSAAVAPPPGGDHWRRTEDLERIQAEEIRAAQQHQQAGGAGLVPPGGPPPSSLTPGPGFVPGGAGSVGSPGTYDGNTTEASGAGGDYATRRRRRRAERQAALGGAGGSGRPTATTEFS
ncbi:MAG: hypothetical protein M4579_006327 [Chaenotheca gracillima]|nr:MAG: hypothetical protein M4579_006327 [Chaenotheca gracillima]